MADSLACTKGTNLIYSQLPLGHSLFAIGTPGFSSQKYKSSMCWKVQPSCMLAYFSLMKYTVQDFLLGHSDKQLCSMTLRYCVLHLSCAGCASRSQPGWSCQQEEAAARLAVQLHLSVLPQLGLQVEQHTGIQRIYCYYTENCGYIHLVLLSKGIIVLFKSNKASQINISCQTHYSSIL